MTLAEFRDIADRGVIVECLNVAQRKNVLELFEECGYHISFASQVWTPFNAEAMQNRLRIQHRSGRPVAEGSR